MDGENPVKQYRYVGQNPSLKGQTALGRQIGRTFKVQVDDTAHPWAFGWHTTKREEWVNHP
jgi:hypothetical protein